MGLSLQTIQSDEFYTFYDDIEKEVSLYKDYFKGKRVYCNCDAADSFFITFFALHFRGYGLKSLTATCYKPNDCGYKYTYDGITVDNARLRGNGDCFSDECREILRQNDIVVTNPPFSCGRDYLKMLLEEDKDFLIIANMNIVSSKGVFESFKNGQYYFGVNKPKRFFTTEDIDGKNITKKGERNIATFGNTCWLTTLNSDASTSPLLTLTKHFAASDYPKYDNYNAIEVGKLADIPDDYYNIMGVPITYLQKHCPQQFEILWLAGSPGCPNDILEELGHKQGTSFDAVLNGKRKFNRVFIRRVRQK